MKLKLLIIGLALAMSASPSFAGGIMMMGGGVEATTCDDTTGMLNATDFEETGTPSGWTGSSGIDYDYTTTHLRGAQSVLVDAGASDRYIDTTFTASGEVWIHALVQWDTLVAHDYTIISGGYSLRILDTDGYIRQGCGDVGTSSDAAVITADTPYHVWVHIATGSGNNATCETYVGTSTTRPASPATTTSSGTIISNFESVTFKANAGASNKVVDQVRIDNASFTTVCD